MQKNTKLIRFAIGNKMTNVRVRNVYNCGCFGTRIGIYSIVNYSRVINEIAAIDYGCHRRNADD